MFLTIQLNDGREADIEVPNNATELDIDNFVKESFPQIDNAQPAPQQEPVQQSQGQYTNMPMDEYLGQVGGQVKQEEKQEEKQKMNEFLDTAKGYNLPVFGGFLKGIGDIERGLGQAIAPGVDYLRGDNQASQSINQEINRLADDSGFFSGRTLGNIVGGAGLAAGGGATGLVADALIGGASTPVETNKDSTNADIYSQKAINAGFGLALGGVGSLVGKVADVGVDKYNIYKGNKEADAFAEKFMPQLQSIDVKNKDVYKQTVANIYKKIKSEPELYAPDKILEYIKNYEKLTKSGYNPNINDVMDGKFDSVIASIYGGKSKEGISAYTEKTAQESMDASRQLFDDIDEFYSKYDIDSAGVNIIETLKNKQEGLREEARDKAKPFYQKAAYGDDLNQFVELSPEDISILEQKGLSEELKTAIYGNKNLIEESRPDYLQPIPVSGKASASDEDFKPEYTVENLIAYRNSLNEKISAAKASRGKDISNFQGNATSLANLYAQKSIINKIAEKYPNIKTADKFYKDYYAENKKRAINKLGQFMGMRPESSNMVVGRLMAKNTSFNQFKAVIDEVGSEVPKEQLLSVVLKSEIDKIRNPEKNIDSLISKLNNSNDTKQKVAYLAGGEDSPLYNQLMESFDVLSKMRSLKYFDTNSTTANKLNADAVNETIKDTTSFFSDLKSSGATSATLRFFSKKLGKNLEENKFDIGRSANAAMYDFFANPKNTERIVNFIGELNAKGVSSAIKNNPSASEMFFKLFSTGGRQLSNKLQNEGNQSESSTAPQEAYPNSDIFKPYKPTYSQQETNTQETDKQSQENDIFKPYKPIYSDVGAQPQSGLEWNKESILPAVRGTESSGNDKAVNNQSGVTARGRYGFNKDTWNLAVNKWGRETGITRKDWMNPQAQEEMAWRLMVDNKKIVENKIGREVLPEEAHILHFFGAGDAPKFFKALKKQPDLPSVLVFGGTKNPVVSKNKEYFFNGKKPLTLSQTYDKFIKNMAG